MKVDYHVHCVAHGERQSTKDNYLLYLETAKRKGIKEVGFVEHDEYMDMVNYRVLEDLKQESKAVKVKIGVEMEMPESPAGYLKLLQYPFDFIISSIHILNGWMFDHPDYRHKYKEYDSDELYKMYFEKLATMLQWDGYNIIGHLDIIKVFNLHSAFQFKPLITNALKALRTKDCAVEINTAGTYKPIGEIYPAPQIISWLYDLDVPVTLSSDAHDPENVGRDVIKSIELIKKAGYRKIATFDKRRRSLIEIDSI